LKKFRSIAKDDISVYPEKPEGLQRVKKRRNIASLTLIEADAFG